MKFINRINELNKLNQLWEENQSQLVVIYGKRRVGKTELIKHFLQNREGHSKNARGIYYLADKRTHKEQLLEFSRVVGNFFKDDFLLKRNFENWSDAFIYLKNKAKSERFLLAIDEYPYLTETDQATSSIFQKGWDEFLKNSKIFMILCGSSISLMESEVLSQKAPLYGRLTGVLNITPMTHEASRKFFPKANFLEFLSYYSITGGMPAYMQKFANYESISEAVSELCWQKFGLYHNEVNFMLKQELRTPNAYFSILKAIAYGKTKMSEIANDTGLEVQLVNKYMDTLYRLQLVKREVPVTENMPEKSKKGMYVLTENFVRFWFHYVYAFSSDLEIGNFSQVKKKFRAEANILEAVAYEQIAREHLFLQSDYLFKMDKVGRYWDKNIEIDGLGLNEKTKKIVFMEAKWSNNKPDIRTLNKLREKAKQVDWYQADRKEYFAIYSKSGFSQDLLKLNKEKSNLLLVKLDQVVK